MSEFTEEKLDVDRRKLEYLEKQIQVTQELLQDTIDSLRDTQKFLIKLAHNQSDITKRVSLWPYIPVSIDKNEE
jgi:hypothetical protein